MGIKSKIKGSYAYTQWKLGKYTKRRVKTSVSSDWNMEQQERERQYANNYYDNFYHNKELENYRSSINKSPDIRPQVVKPPTPRPIIPQINKIEKLPEGKSPIDKPPMVKNNKKGNSSHRSHHTSPQTPINIINEIVENRSMSKPNNEIIFDENRRIELNNEARRKRRDQERYSHIQLQKSDIDDVLVPSRNYKLVQKSDSFSVAYYSPDNRNGKRELVKNFSYTTNTTLPPKNI